MERSKTDKRKPPKATDRDEGELTNLLSSMRDKMSNNSPLSAEKFFSPGFLNHETEPDEKQSDNDYSNVCINLQPAPKRIGR